MSIPNPDKNSYYAAFIEESVHHEGDERSRTHPGHGYPAYTSTHTEVKKFKDEEELKEWILSNERYGQKSYSIVYCTPVAVTKTISLDIVKPT